MKKSLFFTLAIFCITTALSAAISPSGNLKQLYDAKKIDDKCFTCINDQLPGIETAELACLMANIKSGQPIQTIISEFKDCTKTQLDALEKTCESDCTPPATKK